MGEVAPTGLDGRAQHRPVEYSGPGETFVRHIANATYGGQVERPTTQQQQHMEHGYLVEALWQGFRCGPHSELLSFVCFLGYARNVGLSSMLTTD